MSDFILDGSAALAWCFEDESDPTADLAWQNLRDEAAFVPAHWPLEVANGLIMAERRNRITGEDADTFWRTLAQARISVDSDTRAQAWSGSAKLARTHNLTVYDAAYLELAIRLDLPLATLDKALRRAAEAVDVPLLSAEAK